MQTVSCYINKLNVLNHFLKVNSVLNCIRRKMNSENIPKNIVEMTGKEAEKFINSFDHVFLDNDGVSSLGSHCIEGSPSAINELRKIGKQIRFLSNNTLMSQQYFKKKYDRFGIECSEHEFLTPALSIVSYLKKKNFNKKVYLITSDILKQVLIQQGIDVIEDEELHGEIENFSTILTKPLDPDVRYVISDLALNINYPKIVRAYLYLKRNDVDLLITAQDHLIPVDTNLYIPAPNVLLESSVKSLNKSPICLGKPSALFKNYIFENIQIDNPSRVLFVGDTLDVDMNFARLCGFQKLLVFSGVATKEAMENCQCHEKPDYYADSLKDLYELLLCTKK